MNSQCIHLTRSGKCGTMIRRRTGIYNEIEYIIYRLVFHSLEIWNNLLETDTFEIHTLAYFCHLIIYIFISGFIRIWDLLETK